MAAPLLGPISLGDVHQDEVGRSDHHQEREHQSDA